MRSLESLWKTAGCPAESLQHIDIDGSDPVLPSPFKIGEAAAVTIGATALAAAELWRLRTGRQQQVRVDAHAAATAFRSERHLRIDGEPPPALWDDIAGFHAMGDGRWVQLHTNFPHHRERALQVLGCPGDRRSVAETIADWNGEQLEADVFLQAYRPGALDALGMSPQALAALARRTTEGGSYLVRVSLAQTGHWLKGLGRIEQTGVQEPSNEDIGDLLEISKTPFGFVEHLAPAMASMSETPMRWATSPVPLGTHGPRWW